MKNEVSRLKDIPMSLIFTFKIFNMKTRKLLPNPFFSLIIHICIFLHCDLVAQNFTNGNFESGNSGFTS